MQSFNKFSLQLLFRWNHLKSSVISVLLYGCETWRTTKADEKKLDAFLHKSLRRILKIYWPMRITNEEVRRRAGIRETITDQVARQRWTWLGHVLRMWVFGWRILSTGPGPQWTQTESIRIREKCWNSELNLNIFVLFEAEKEKKSTSRIYWLYLATSWDVSLFLFIDFTVGKYIGNLLRTRQSETEK